MSFIFIYHLQCVAPQSSSCLTWVELLLSSFLTTESDKICDLGVKRTGLVCRWCIWCILSIGYWINEFGFRWRSSGSRALQYCAEGLKTTADDMATRITNGAPIYAITSNYLEAHQIKYFLHLAEVGCSVQRDWLHPKIDRIQRLSVTLPWAVNSRSGKPKEDRKVQCLGCCIQREKQ